MPLAWQTLQNNWNVCGMPTSELASGQELLKRSLNTYLKAGLKVLLTSWLYNIKSSMNSANLQLLLILIDF